MKLFMTCDAVGGVWQYATDLADQLAGQGIDVVLAVMGPGSPLPPLRERDGRGTRQGEGSTDAPGAYAGPSPDLPALGHPLPQRREREGSVTVLPTDLPLDWLATGPDVVRAAGRAIAALAARHGADVIHLNSPALAAASPFPAPVIAVAHGCVGTWWEATNGTAPDASYAWHRELVRAGLLAADAVVAPSAAYAEAVQRHYDLPVAPLAIHNGRTALPLATVEPADHVLTVGRLWDRAKNIDLLDRAAALLPVPLRAAGSTVAPHGETVTPRHLGLLGVLDGEALAAEYARAPIFVSAARFEPFGLAVLEAAQAGCPLVLSGIDTFRELWAGAALIVADDTPEAYAAAIERVRTEPGLRHHLGEAARLRAARYTPAAMASAMLALYRSLVPQERAAA